MSTKIDRRLVKSNHAITQKMLTRDRENLKKFANCLYLKTQGSGRKERGSFSPPAGEVLMECNRYTPRI